MVSQVHALLGCGSEESRQRLFADLFMQHRRQLRCMVESRLDVRLQARVDPSDVLQEAYLDASRRLGEYLRSVPMPFYLWLRRIAGQKLVDLYRQHMGARGRDVRKQVPFGGDGLPEASSEMLAARFLADQSTPSKNVLRDEAKAALLSTLASMDPQDREILALRHFEEMSNADAARVLGIAGSAASKRHIRALKRLQACLSPSGRGG